MQLKYTQKGAAAVEFAVVLPFLMIVFYLIIEFGMMFYDKAIITNASREAARAGIVYNACLQKLTDEAIQQVAIDYSANHLIPKPSSLPVVTFPNPTDRCVSGNRLTVTVVWTYNMFVLGNLFRLVGSDVLEEWLLSATTVMSHE